MPKIILIDIHIHFLKPKLWHKTTYKQTIIIKFASFAAIKKKKKSRRVGKVLTSTMETRVAKSLIRIGPLHLLCKLI